MRKAIFFDIDGTLIDCPNGIYTITPKVEKVIRKLQDKGHYVFITTGRPYAFIAEDIANYGFDLSIPIERSYAFGDGRNDIEMLKTVGCGIANRE